ncbi:hypothetical protein BDW22DRAFT_1302883, partial [Trametopsis cervina]
EEVVLNVQGYLLRSSLPPIFKMEQLPKNPRAAKQSVVLTGLGSDRFDDCGRAVMEIHSYFSTVLPPDTLLPWNIIRDEGNICLEFANRYFASMDLSMPEQQAIEFSKATDPNRVLENLASDLIHTDDNEVLYFERFSTAEPLYVYISQVYVACDPIGVRLGQLVEVQVAFCTVPISKGRHLMLSKLRSVCILSRDVQSVRRRDILDLQDMNHEAFSIGKRVPISPTKKLKRRVGY